jgi:glutaredoxin 3
MDNIFNRLFNRHPESIKANVEIYTWQTCPFCIRAKLLLWWKGVEYKEYKIDGDEAARNAMAQRAGGKRTVPQIFINDRHVGGCDDLYQLDSRGELNTLLAQS